MATKKPNPNLTKVRPLPHDQENKVPRTKPPIDDVIDKTTKGMPSETPKPGTAVMSYKDRMAALVAQTKKAEAPQGGFISFKGGRMSIGQTQLPGDMLRAIIIDYRKDNEFYPSAYDPKNTAYASCHAIRQPWEVMSPWRRPREGEDLENLNVVRMGNDVFVTDAEDPQVQAGQGCDSCQMLEFGSMKFVKGAVRKKGKACRESRRVHVFAADQCTTPEDVARASYMTMIPPPTSLDNFRTFANEATEVLKTPVFGVVVDISVKAHDDYLFMVYYKIVEQIKDEGILNALLTRHEQIRAKPIVMPKKEDDDATKEQRGSGKF